MDMSAEAKPAAGLRAPPQTEFLAPAVVLWRRVLLALVVVALAHTFLRHTRPLTELFFFQQDFAVAVGCMLLLTSLHFVQPLARAPPMPAPDWRVASLIALATTAFAWAGSRLVYDGYALSLDEFLARFDARIFQAGQWVGQVPAALRDYAPALQPQFVLYAPDHASWISGYEPMNPGLQALASLVGAQSLVSPALAGLAVIATWGAARRLWPDKPGMAVTAAVLLATSSQVLVTAMTPYAMTAHLALNMAWLWLFLRGGRLGHGLAPLAAFVATGLHQIVFHPLFAAPFVLELWLQRRWKAAAWHSLAYALIGGFWLLYPGQVAHHMATGQQAVAAVATQTNILARAAWLISAFDLGGLGLMAKNLVRFFTWQSLLTVPLALAALPAAIRAKGMLRAMVIGLALTTAAMLVLLPYQGHGWGYRYLHGLLGTLSLLAAWSWTRLADAQDPARQRAARAVFAAAAAASLLILLPIRLWQVHAFVHPYAVAERAIQASHADVVLVDSEAMWFGADLVRNDPFLRNRPVVMELGALKPEQVQVLCGRYRVAMFGAAEAKAAGIRLSGVATRNPQQLGCERPG
jgi:hypothetical protein